MSDAVGWQPETDPAPVDALAGREGVVHLAGESIAQRWTQKSKERIHSSRELGTMRLVEGLAQSELRPRTLVNQMSDLLRNGPITRRKLS